VSRKNYVLENRIHQSAAQKQAEQLRQAIGNTDAWSGSQVSLLFWWSGTHLRSGVPINPLDREDWWFYRTVWWVYAGPGRQRPGFVGMFSTE